MPGKPGVTVTGAVETERALAHMAAGLNDPATHRSAGEVELERALDLVPRDSGRLAGSIRLEIRDDGADVVAGSSLVPYAGVIEYGWPARGIAAQPYLEDAADQRADDVHNVYADHVESLVRRFDREGGR